MPIYRTKPLDEDSGADFLTQEEVDSLLKGVASDIDWDDDTDPSEPVTYDLGRQERIVRGRMPALELINERFARIYRTEFFKKFGRATEVSVGPIRVQSYSTFIRNLIVPTNLNIIDFNQSLYGSGLVIFEPSFVYLCVDSAFGSDGRFHTRVEGRDFTLIEQSVIMEMFDVFRSAYMESFSRVFPLDIRYIRSEMNTQFANIATPSEIVVTTAFCVEMAGNCAEMHVCIPYNTLEPIVKPLKSPFTPDVVESNGSNKRITVGMIQNDLVIRAEKVCLVEDVGQWKVGDTIVFDTYTGYVEDKPLFGGEYLSNFNKFTIQSIHGEE